MCVQPAVEYHALTQGEIADFESKWGAPLESLLIIFNAISCERDDQSMRIYGGHPNHTAIMWNQGFNVVCRERFELHDFPVDVQELSLELRLNNPQTWEKFDMLVTGVQLHLQAIQQTEWKVMSPTVFRDTPANKVTRVSLRVQRLPHFYFTNVVGIMFCLGLLGLLAFTMPIVDIGDRVNTLLTLILTGVAFKFVLASALPKMPYNTLLDYFVLMSMASLAINAFLSVVPHYLPLIVGGNRISAEVVNFVVAGIGGTIVAMITILWLVVAFRTQRRKQAGHKPVQAVENKNWYLYYFYGLPPFLSPN